MEIADLLASASSHETPLGAAVLLEQSSSHYYKAGMYRKFAFHMLMAGHMFRSASNQDRHAFRCFAASLYVYHGERWGELRSHLRSALAAQLYGMGRYALSMQFYANLIGTTGKGAGRVSVKSQQKFLNHIVNVCGEHREDALVAIDRINSVVEGKRTADDVLKGFTAAAFREIELSNIGFPRVIDSSIRVCVDGTGSGSSNSLVSLGRSDSLPIMTDDGFGSLSDKGDESVWQDMMNCTEAELRLAGVPSTVTAGGAGGNSSEHNSSHDDGGGPAPSLPSAHSGDKMIDTVIMEIDKEERDAEYRERQKRKSKSGGGLGTSEVRATSEPLAVTFSLKNPLGLDIDLVDMQVVALLACPKTGLLHTNEYSISTNKEEAAGSSPKSLAEKRKWTFHGSDDQFQSPEFMCQLSMDDNSSSSASAIDSDSGPYFVVTKSLLKVGPNADAVASLKICPLVEGDLRILGVRFHLLDEVWIYHRFDVKGPLLQDSRVNRSKRSK